MNVIAWLRFELAFYNVNPSRQLHRHGDSYFYISHSHWVPILPALCQNKLTKRQQAYTVAPEMILEIVYLNRHTQYFVALEPTLLSILQPWHSENGNLALFIRGKQMKLLKISLTYRICIGIIPASRRAIFFLPGAILFFYLF